MLQLNAVKNDLQKKVAYSEQMNKSAMKEERLIDEIKRLKVLLKNARWGIQDLKGCKIEILEQKKREKMKNPKCKNSNALHS